MYLLIVTGLSGAGKSQAIRKLEDIGFYCVDNLPSEMLPNFIRLCMSASPKVERTAVVVDSRSAVFESNMERAFSILDELGVVHRVLFLDCRNDVLIRRYNETRRRHPMAEDVSEGIMLERGVLMPLRESADYVIDTGDMKPQELNKRIEELVTGSFGGGFILTLESFGYKRGIPAEADFIFDMRFSENPFYIPELKLLSGMDEPVRCFVLSDTDFLATLNSIEAMVRRLVPRYIEQGKHRLHMAFGCTGGRHRSVCAAQEMYNRLSGDFDARIVHRDINAEAKDIRTRMGDTEDR